MKYRWFWLVAVILSFWFCRTAMKEAHDQVHAQSSGTLSGNGPHTGCSTPAAGSFFLCLATDGIWVSNGGAAYFQIVAPTTAAPSGVQKVNGVAPGATGNVTVQCPISQPQPVTFTGTSTLAATVSLSTVCSASGS